MLKNHPDLFTSLTKQADALGINTSSLANISVQIANSGKGVEQDMIDAFTTEMQEAYQKYGDDEEIVHSMMDGIMCETLEKLGFAKGVEIFDKAPKWYA